MKTLRRAQFILALVVLISLPAWSVRAQQAEQGAIVFEGDMHDNAELRRLRIQFNAQPLQVPGNSRLQIWRVDAARSQDLREALATAHGTDQWHGLAALDFDFRNIVSSVSEEELSPAQRSTLDALAASRGRRPLVVRSTEAPVLNQAFSYGLPTNGLPSNARSMFQLELAPGRVLTMQGESSQLTTSQTWEGAPTEGGYATFSNDERDVRGFISTRETTIELRPLGNGYEAVLERPTSHRPGDEPPQFLERAAGADNSGATHDAPPGRLNRIDVLVAYTPLAGALAPLQHKTFGEDPIRDTNEAFADAGLQNLVQLNLTDVVAINYDERRSWEDMTSALFHRGQPLHDNLQTLRDHYHADIVILIITGGEWCGEAGSIGPNRDSAFAVVDESCLSNFSFAHEIGHLFGMRHDRAVDTDSTPFAFGHGYVMNAIGERTIMAYPDACPDCVRIRRWSDPRATYKGAPLGTPQWEDEERVVRATAARLARFYP